MNKYGELQIHHISEDETKAIVSVFLEGTESDEENEFWSNLNPFIWLPEDGSDKGAKTLYDTINLDQIYCGGFNKNFDKSFFYYRGSDHKPPCEEGVEHFILQKSLKVSNKYLDFIIRSLRQPGNDLTSNRRKI